MGRVGDDLVEAFEEMAAHLRDEVDVESYDVPARMLLPEKIKSIRQKVACSKRAFDNQP